jgi:hypothetical protein
MAMDQRWPAYIDEISNLISRSLVDQQDGVWYGDVRQWWRLWASYSSMLCAVSVLECLLHVQMLGGLSMSKYLTFIYVWPVDVHLCLAGSFQQLWR